MMLDKAKNVDEALELLSSHDMHSSANSCYHFQICDASGKSVVVEYVDNEMKVVYPDKNYQCATNFLLTNPDAEFNFGQDRYQIIDEKLSSTMENYPIVRLCSFYPIVHKMNIRIIREKSQRHSGLVYMI